MTSAVDRAANERTVRRLFSEGFDDGRAHVVDEVCAAEFCNRTVPPGVAGDRENLKETIRQMSAAFSGQSYAIHDVVSDGDRVVVRATQSGTHTGTFRGIAPTQRAFSINATHWFRLKDGLIVEHWGTHDDLGMLVQIGLAPQLPHPTQVTEHGRADAGAG